ncbi:hypothetical protein [Nevskia ramosa]|uniref:hypothetical protein n=1 Tax=Nevskia ramosa TaxID=64002 RepID=UPI003D0F8C2F
MKVYYKGVAEVRHKSTGEVFKIESDELDWDAVGGDERSMGPETHYQAEVEHPELGTLTWSLWEYPVGVENQSQTDAGSHEVIQDFDYGLEHEREPDDYDWMDHEPPENPYDVFMDSYHQTQDLLAHHGSDKGNALVNRLVFSHQVTALEAYLGDTLVNAVMADSAAMKRLMVGDTDLKERKFTLDEIAADPDLVCMTIREHLRSILYHNLKKVDALFNVAINCKILSLSSDKPALFRAIGYRHDCVHRNGCDKNGQELMVFTRTFVQETADLIKKFVERIESAVHNNSSPL